MASTNPARGMRDFLPADVRKRNYVINIIKEVYESYGFEPLETPAVENLETLTGKYGEEGNQLIFKILKRGEKLKLEEESSLEPAPLSLATDGYLMPSSSGLADLALRYDLTVPLARVVANNRNELPKFFKRYQVQPVWRADRPARGRFREFYQCDVDSIGSNSIVVEAELISAVSEILNRLGFLDYKISLNHREVLFGLLNAANVPKTKHIQSLVVLDKMDKIGWDAVKAELIGLGIGESAADKLSYVRMADEAAIEVFETLDNESWNKQTISYLRKAVIGEFDGSEEDKSRFESGIANLEESLALLTTAKHGSNIRLNFHLARGLSYYTGAIMEINVPDLAGSLGGGGRYDGLIGMFGKEQIPACGFSLGLERILVVMDERGMFPPEIAESSSADVLVTIWSDETIAESLKLASELRSSGLRVTLYPEADKLGKQIKYADSIKVPWVCVLGESEIAENKVTLKNLASGEQNTFMRDEIASKIK